MEKWRIIFLSGVVIGILTNILDYQIKSIQIMVVIVAELISIILIFTGMILRRKDKKR